MRTRWSLHPEIEAGLGSLPPLPFEAAEISKDAIPAIREAMRRPAGVPDHMRHDELVVHRGPAVPSLSLHVYAPRGPADQVRPDRRPRPASEHHHNQAPTQPRATRASCSRSTPTSSPRAPT